jgi:hypothetical protein
MILSMGKQKNSEKILLQWPRCPSRILFEVAPELNSWLCCEKPVSRLWLQSTASEITFCFHHHHQSLYSSYKDFHTGGFVILLRHTVGLLWTSDQPIAKASTYTGQHNRNTKTNIHALSGIRTHNPSNKAAIPTP